MHLLGILTSLLELLLLLCVDLYIIFKDLLTNVCWNVRKDISNDVVLITGAGRGIGQEMCLEFAKYSKHVIAWDINKAGLSKTFDLVFAQRNVKIMTYVCDVSSPDDIKRNADFVKRDIGVVTILVNNAGIVNGKRMLDLSSKEIEKCFQVNTLSHFETIRAFLPGMLGGLHVAHRLGLSDKSETQEELVTSEASAISSLCRGHIVSIASIAGHIPAPQMGDYCASKAASILLHQVLETELLKAGVEQQVRLTSVRPFFINTNMFCGCSYNIPWLISTIDPNILAKRIVDGIRRNERIIFTPPIITALPGIYFLLPLRCLRRVYEFSGVLSMMDLFRGYKSSESIAIQATPVSSTYPATSIIGCIILFVFILPIILSSVYYLL